MLVRVSKFEVLRISNGQTGFGVSRSCRTKMTVAPIDMTSVKGMGTLLSGEHPRPYTIQVHRIP